MKILVIGSGIAGASVAFHAARAGASVTIVDNDQVGRATAAGAGIVCPWTKELGDPAYTLIGNSAAEYYPELVAALGSHMDPSAYRQVGALTLPRAGQGNEGMLEHLLNQRDESPLMGDVQIWDQAQAESAFPALSSPGGAVHIPGTARVNGELMRRALLDAAQAHGASVIDGTAELAGGGRARIDGAPVEADAVVVAAGTWAPQMLEPLGVSVPVEPQRGQIVHLRLEGVDASRWPVVLPDGDHYMLTFDDSRIVIGATR